MLVYFLRHGLAANAETWKGDDGDRPLTDKGRDRMVRVARKLAGLDLDLDKIVTSPLLRAKQTANIVADAMKLTEKVTEDGRLAGGFGVEALAGILHDHVDAEAIMLVGHEPNMSETIGHVLGSVRVDLKKGAIACVEFPDPTSSTSRLLWLAPPKVLTG
jgi:phosphohistidine phosphatase